MNGGQNLKGNRMNIAICDDEKQVCDILEDKVREFLPGAVTRVFLSGQDILAAEPFPDILLLDIKMPGMDGMEVAQAMRDRGWDGILIFITGEEDRVFQSFDLRAFHFLVKPVSDEKLNQVLIAAVDERKQLDTGRAGQTDKYITIRTGSSHIRIDLRRLIYAEVFDRKTLLHTTKENIEYYGQLSALERLVGKDFCRIHRSYMVNMRYVERYDRTMVTMTNGDTLPIARRSYDDLLTAYMQYNRRRGAL